MNRAVIKYIKDKKLVKLEPVTALKSTRIPTNFEEILSKFFVKLLKSLHIRDFSRSFQNWFPLNQFYIYIFFIPI